MTTGSIVVMIIGMVIIWGGLAASIVHAIGSSKKNNARDTADNV